jgi:superfamily II DNA or RNA helicase
MDKDQQLLILRAELAHIEVKRLYLISQIACLENSDTSMGASLDSQCITHFSPVSDKIKLFRTLFHGRQDVYPRRFESTKTGKSGYQPVCKNEWVTKICRKTHIKCNDCPSREYMPLTDQVIEWHLRGNNPNESPLKEFIAGIYPMLVDETCWFLAADFDKFSWEEDITAFRQTCIELGVSVSVERSRSGNGGHAWIFFSEPIPCSMARMLGAYLVTETMQRRPEIGLDSYDRFFPNQDTLPHGGFGNLIALPLQKKPRDNGNTIFLNDNFLPYPDPWEYLSSVRRMTRQEIQTIIDNASKNDEIIGLRLPTFEDNENDKPWDDSPSRNKKRAIIGPFPVKIEIVYANQIFIPKKDLSASLRNALIRIAAFQNPEFYKKQAMRLPIFNLPRVISCAENFNQYIALPRGCLSEVVELLRSLGIEVVICDKRISGEKIDIDFCGTLYSEQQKAAAALLMYENGILAATTAFGKTVIAAYLIAHHKVNTLVLVHRKQLLEQWHARLEQFLDLHGEKIGQIGGGKRKPTGIIDIALLQSLSRKGTVDDIVANYGHLVIDECHHISAPSFEIIAREFKGKYVTGLSATVTRKDGHHPIIFMNCGPVRFKVDSKKQAAKRPFEHKLVIRNTSFGLPANLQDNERVPISEIYTALMNDNERNALIIKDVLENMERNRFPVLLTERREHLDYFSKVFQKHLEHIVVFKGGMGKKQLQEETEKLNNLPDDMSALILATGRYLGEGFDFHRLDTLFLALPISWKGTVAQYAGRLHRLYYNKSKVVIYDYVDINVPMLTRMFERRLRGYKAIGYEIES